MIPVHIIQKNVDGASAPSLPDDRLCYLVGSNGVFKQVVNDFYSVRVPVDEVAHLAEIREHATINVPKLPIALLRQAEAFFMAVYQQHRSEAVVLLLLNPNTEEWRIEVPVQGVRGLHVSYNLSTLPDPPSGFSRFGTIHSHANIKAFHSGTDDGDEIGFDGLHITIGNVDQPIRSYSARWMLAGREFKSDLINVIEAEPVVAFDSSWLDKVQAVQEETRLFESCGAFPPRTASSPGVEREYESAEEYQQHLLAMREEIDEQLWEAGLAER